MRRIGIFGIVFFVGLAGAIDSFASTSDIKIYRNNKGIITITDDASSSTSKHLPTPNKYSGNLTYADSEYDQDFRKKTTPISKVPAQFLAKIKRLAYKHGLNESLVISVARTESGFNQYAISKKGAVGLMQLMKDTARSYGVRNRFDADQNLEAGVKHLKYLYEKYDHNLPLTLAAYNAGEEAVKKYNGVPPYTETRQYVKRIMRLMGLSYSGAGDSSYAKTTTPIYKYRTKDGRTVFSDSYPTDAVGEITVMD